MKEMNKKSSIIVLEHSEIMNEEELLYTKGGYGIVSCNCKRQKCTGGACLQQIQAPLTHDNKDLSIC